MPRPRTPITAVTTALVAAAVLGAGSAPASAATTCAKWASTGGSDAAAGTQTAPYRSLGKLAGALAAGQTGCLPAGETYYAVEGNGIVGSGAGTSAAPITITSGPGGRASVKGQVWLQPASHDVTFTGLDFKGEYFPNGTPVAVKGEMLIVHGDRIAFIDDDIADPMGICLGAGKANATDASVNDVAEDLRVVGNRIHDCGMDLSIPWTDGDSGAHGVYLENTLRARVSDNLIYRNRYRGLQLWPRNDAAIIERNVFDENATQVNIGSSLGEYGGSFMAQNTIVRDNIMSGRVTTFRVSQNPSQLYGFFPDASPSYGNQVLGNCFAPGDPAATGSGFTLGANTTAQALFTDRAARDYRLLASSPCLGKGPASIQPTTTAAPADRAVAVTAPASGTTGAELTSTVTVRDKTATAGPATVTITTAGGKLLGLRSSAGTCSGATCTATLAASGTFTVAVRLGATTAGTATVTARLGEADATPADNTASAATSVTGPACTFAGTDGADTVQGTAAAETFCLFGGDDTVMPAGGNDRVLGGSGRDRVSYWNAGGPVVINLGQSEAWDAGATAAIGDDTLSSVEWATGSAYADTLVGSAAADTLDGLEGADELWGYGGDDTLKGWTGDDHLYGGDGNDTLDGADGSDTCNQGAGTGPKTGCEL